MDPGLQALAVLSSLSQLTVCISKPLKQLSYRRLGVRCLIQTSVKSKRFVITWMSLDPEPWRCHIGCVCISEFTDVQICREKVGANLVLTLHTFCGWRVLCRLFAVWPHELNAQSFCSGTGATLLVFIHLKGACFVHPKTALDRSKHSEDGQLHFRSKALVRSKILP